jgi:hypothetical protein
LKNSILLHLLCCLAIVLIVVIGQAVSSPRLFTEVRKRSRNTEAENPMESEYGVGVTVRSRALFSFLFHRCTHSLFVSFTVRQPCGPPPILGLSVTSSPMTRPKLQLSCFPRPKGSKSPAVRRARKTEAVQSVLP